MFLFSLVAFLATFNASSVVVFCLLYFIFFTSKKTILLNNFTAKCVNINPKLNIRNPK